MRVIAGRLGGRRLKAPRGRTTRPTSEKVREALFAMLGDLAGLDVLDLFAGTGALGIEALSRGARTAVFVELEPVAVRILGENLAALDISGEHANVRHTDALQALRSARGRKETYDLLFIDPPYSQAREWGPELAALVPSLLRPAARVVLESNRRAPLDLARADVSPPHRQLELERHRRYGDTTIQIHRLQ
jgi:16S rRNA (guanine966-N2)-methyltransferase